MIGRRRFLDHGSVLAASLPTVARAAGTQRLAVGVQLYMLRDLLNKDIDGTLAAVAEIGISYIEFAGFYERDAAQWQRILAANSLVAVGAHALYPQMTDEQVARSIDVCATLGLEWIVSPVPIMPAMTLPITQASFRASAERITADDIKASAERFNLFGERAKRAGLRFAYHNHGFDQRRFGNTSAIDMLLALTDPELVALELDIGHMIAAGGDPMPYLVPRGRVHLVHVKDWHSPYQSSLYAMPSSATIGEGTIDWPLILAAIQRLENPCILIEQEELATAEVLALLETNYRKLEGMIS